MTGEDRILNVGACRRSAAAESHWHWRILSVPGLYHIRHPTSLVSENTSKIHCSQAGRPNTVRRSLAASAQEAARRAKQAGMFQVKSTGPRPARPARQAGPRPATKQLGLLSSGCATGTSHSPAPRPPDPLAGGCGRQPQCQRVRSREPTGRPGPMSARITARTAQARRPAGRGGPSPGRRPPASPSRRHGPNCQDLAGAGPCS